MLRLLFGIVFWWLLHPVVVLADEESTERYGIGNPAVGQIKSKAELCQGCHGESGNSTSAEFPKLTGQYAAYITKQLSDFRTSLRKHPVMNAMAANLNEEDMADIASYFASNLPMQAQSPVTDEAAQRLFLKGDMKRNILACVSCHGANGRGATLGGESFPALAGQHKFYLREQLLNWKSGARHNSPGGVMNVITQSLSVEEIESLASYISGL